MIRSDFIKTLLTTTIMATLNPLKSLGILNSTPGKAMPVLFVGHGSPMNGIENNEFSKNWKSMGNSIPTPRAIICVSAHWLTRGTLLTAMEAPKTIHDFGGFPKALYEINYPAPGEPTLAKQTVEFIKTTHAGLNHDWGLDHGTWTVVRHMYPDANIPVLQLSIDYTQPAAYHYQLGAELAGLRKKGVLIIGSGNMVHNLKLIAWDKLNNTNFGYDWAIEMNELFKKNILTKNHQPLINYETLSDNALKAIPTPDHYYPLLYALSIQSNTDELEIFNDKPVGGSLTMTSLKIG